MAATRNQLCTSTPQAISLFPDIIPAQSAIWADDQNLVANCHLRSVTHLGAQGNLATFFNGISVPSKLAAFTAHINAAL
jgi:hypothetical protein